MVTLRLGNVVVAARSGVLGAVALIDRAHIRVHAGTKFQVLSSWHRYRLVFDQGPAFDGLLVIFAVAALAIAGAKDSGLEALTVFFEAG